ncbi:hypothetical protein FRC07_002249 [Ceratobasidium sp. 392]|nr:hypothetical protein FRC07_002249 [Ceratobasidium sp. 392]
MPHIVQPNTSYDPLDYKLMHAAMLVNSNKSLASHQADTTTSNYYTPDYKAMQTEMLGIKTKSRARASVSNTTGVDPQGDNSPTSDSWDDSDVLAYYGTPRKSHFAKYYSERRFFRSKITASAELHERLLQSDSGEAMGNLRRAIRGVKVAEQRNQPSTVIELYKICMKLVPQVIGNVSGVRSRYDWITGQWGTVVTDAISYAIRVQDYELATEWFDQGRCFIWGQILRLRTSLDDLRSASRELADDLQTILLTQDQELVSEFASSSLPPEKVERPSRGIIQVHYAVARRDAIIDMIRELPGFGNFLSPPKVSELAAHIRDGALVLIHLTKQRCDALLIRPDTQPAISYLPLNNFSYDKAIKARVDATNNLSYRGVSIKRDPSKAIKQVLSMLWYDLVQPVLTQLNISHVLPVEELPHITWCTSGPLALLPLHAAGDYTNPGTILYNLAVSSFTHSISTLCRPSSIRTPFSGMLLVGHEKSVRGLNALPGTRAELAEVQAKFADLRCTQLNNEDACTEKVVKALKDHNWMHIACHGSQNNLQSAFHLHDRDLDIATIVSAGNLTGQLAFLSACQTATGDENLPNEAVHLAAGLLTVGFSTVVATMWSIVDQDAPVVAGKFYEYMLQGEKPDPSRAARALHKATAYLRDQIGVDKFGRWAPFIHMGA